MFEVLKSYAALQEYLLVAAAVTKMLTWRVDLHFLAFL